MSPMTNELQGGRLFSRFDGLIVQLFCIMVAVQYTG